MELLDFYIDEDADPQGVENPETGDSTTGDHSVPVPEVPLVYRFINTFTIVMIDGILVRNQNGHNFKTSKTGLER